MSGPEPAPAGRGAVDVAPGGAAVRVEAGTADVFYLGASGGEVPLASLGPGAVVVPAAGTTLRVVPRIDGRLAPGADDAAGVGAFVDALAGRLGHDATATLATTPPDRLGEALGPALDAYATALADRRTRQRRLGQDQDRRLVEAAYRRARQDVEHPGAAPETRSRSPLVATVQRLGELQGFTVVEPVRTPGAGDDEPRLAALLHASGVRARPVRLRAGWARDRARPYLAFLTDPVAPDGDPGLPVALVPGRDGYRLQRPDTDRTEPLTPTVERALTGVHQLYPPLPRTRAVSWRDVARLALRGSAPTWRWAAAAGLAVTVLGLLTPVLTTAVVGTIIPEGERGLLAAVGVALVIAAGCAGAFSFVQYLALSRYAQRANEAVQSAFWDRVLAMPPAFFRDFSAGDLSVRVMAVDALQQVVNVQVAGALLAAGFSLVNLIVLFALSVPLGLAATAVLASVAGVLVWAVRGMRSLYTRSVEAQLAGTSWVVQLLGGIAKVRLADAEARLRSRYLDLVRRQVVSMSAMTRVLGRAQSWTLFAATAAPAALFAVVGLTWDPGTGASIDTAGYLAFSTAFLTVFGAMSALAAVVTPLASAGPIFALLDPLMTALPESATHRADPGLLTGDLELRNVTFRYGPDSPAVLDGLSLRARPGEMVALVGPSGSGKSTTVRLVLGFDEPDDGQVLLDGRDLRDLDLDLVRAQMGVVVQNGRISRGSILTNILGGAGGTEDDAWAAARAAALADDIADMPMGMHTIVDPQLLSGGQAQRLLLARALVRRPTVVILDEATSALDNASQAAVTDALDRLGVTRVVIAHRLSTIRAADRILVVVAGRVVEEGTFEELVAAGGEFAALAARQLA